MHLRIINNSQFNTIKKDGSITVNDVTIPADDRYIYGVIDDPNEVIVLEDKYTGSDRFPSTLSAELIEKIIRTDDDGKGYTCPCFYKWLAPDDYNTSCVPLNVLYDSVNGYWKIEFAYDGDSYWSDASSSNILSNGRLRVYKYPARVPLYQHVVSFTTSVQLTGYENPVTVQGYLSYLSHHPASVYTYESLYSSYLHSYDNKPKLLDELTFETNNEIINVMSVAHIIPRSSSEYILTVFFINADGLFDVASYTLSSFDSCNDYTTEVL